MSWFRKRRSISWPAKRLTDSYKHYTRLSESDEESRKFGKEIYFIKKRRRSGISAKHCSCPLVASCLYFRLVVGLKLELLRLPKQGARPKNNPRAILHRPLPLILPSHASKIFPGSSPPYDTAATLSTLLSADRREPTPEAVVWSLFPLYSKRLMHTDI